MGAGAAQFFFAAKTTEHGKRPGASRAGGFDVGGCVADHQAFLYVYTKHLGGMQEGIRKWLGEGEGLRMQNDFKIWVEVVGSEKLAGGGLIAGGNDGQRVARFKLIKHGDHARNDRKTFGGEIFFAEAKGAKIEHAGEQAVEVEAIEQFQKPVAGPFDKMDEVAGESGGFVGRKNAGQWGEERRDALNHLVIAVGKRAIDVKDERADARAVKQWQGLAGHGAYFSRGMSA